MRLQPDAERVVIKLADVRLQALVVWLAHCPRKGFQAVGVHLLFVVHWLQPAGVCLALFSMSGLGNKKHEGRKNKSVTPAQRLEIE